MRQLQVLLVVWGVALAVLAIFHQAVPPACSGGPAYGACYRPPLGWLALIVGYPLLLVLARWESRHARGE